MFEQFNVLLDHMNSCRSILGVKPVSNVSSLVENTNANTMEDGVQRERMVGGPPPLKDTITLELRAHNQQQFCLLSALLGIVGDIFW